MGIIGLSHNLPHLYGSIIRTDSREICQPPRQPANHHANPCKEKYSLISYEEAKTKQLQKLAKQAAPKLDDENLDEEALLQMTEDIPLNEEDLNSNEDNILEDTDESENSGSDLSGMVDGYDDENNDG